MLSARRDIPLRCGWVFLSLSRLTHSLSHYIFLFACVCVDKQAATAQLVATSA